VIGKTLLAPAQRPKQVVWPSAGFVDTEKRWFMKLEVGYGEAIFGREFRLKRFGWLGNAG
jgi:hypothetical protein